MSMNYIIPNLYLGNIDAAQDFRGLKAAGITHVLQAMCNMDT